MEEVTVKLKDYECTIILDALLTLLENRKITTQRAYVPDDETAEEIKKICNKLHY